MSFGIVRVQKFKAADVKGIQIHDHRERPSRTNPDIDKERTPQNYSLVQSENWNEAIKSRLETLESTKAVRKDAVVMVQVLVTSDHEFFKGLTPEKEKAFFEQSLKFIQDRYGKENVFSAVVHKDERTPHMHVNLTPIRDRRLTAKEVFNRANVTSLHTDFHASVGQNWGLERGQSREEKRQHFTVEEFKIKTADQRLEAQREALNEKAKQYNASLIQPHDVEPRILKKSMLGLMETKESSRDVAERLNVEYVIPTRQENERLHKENKGHELTLFQHQQQLAHYRELKRDYFDGLTHEQRTALKVAVEDVREKNKLAEQQKRQQMREQAIRGQRDRDNDRGGYER